MTTAMTGTMKCRQAIIEGDANLPQFFYQVTGLRLKTAGFVILALIFLLAGCMVRPADLGPNNSTYFRPPTPRVGLTPTRAVFIEKGSETPGGTALACKNNLDFIKDLTIPDGTDVSPESTLDKRWEVENNGGCNWGEGYRLRLIAGPDLGLQKEQALYPARSGGRTVIRMAFKAPSEPGTYRSAWQAFSPQGEAFGDPLFIEIKVTAPSGQ